MSDKINDHASDHTDEEILAYEVSDEALEAVAIKAGGRMDSWDARSSTAQCCNW
jgi:hypothetical protein